MSEARDEDELSRRESTDNRKKGEFELLVLLAPRARLMSYVATMRYLLERIALGIIYSQLARASNCVFAPRLRTENQPDLDLSFMPLSLSPSSFKLNIKIRIMIPVRYFVEVAGFRADCRGFLEKSRALSLPPPPPEKLPRCYRKVTKKIVFSSEARASEQTSTNRLDTTPRTGGREIVTQRRKNI